MHKYSLTTYDLKRVNELKEEEKLKRENFSSREIGVPSFAYFKDQNQYSANKLKEEKSEQGALMFKVARSKKDLLEKMSQKEDSGSEYEDICIQIEHLDNSKQSLHSDELADKINGMYKQIEQEHDLAHKLSFQESPFRESPIREVHPDRKNIYSSGNTSEIRSQSSRPEQPRKKLNLLQLFQEDYKMSNHIFTNERVKRNWRKLKTSLVMLSLQKETFKASILKSTALFQGASRSQLLINQSEHMLRQKSYQKIINFLIKFFLSLSMIYSIIWVPIRLGFQAYFDEETKLITTIIDIVIDAFWMINILIEIFKFKILFQVGKQMDDAMVDNTYLKGLFILDLVASIPLQFAEDNLYILKYFRFIRYQQVMEHIKGVKQFLITSVFNILHVQEDKQIEYQKESYVSLFLQTNIYILLICNNAACIRQWYLNFFNFDQFAYNLANSTFELYINNLYFAVLTFVSVGYGVTQELQFVDLFAVCLMMQIGPPVFAYVVGNFKSQQIALQQQESKQKTNNLQTIEWISQLERNSSKKLPVYIIDQIKEQNTYEKEFDITATLTYELFFFRLPFAVQQKIVKYMTSDFIRQFKLFFESHSNVFIQLVLINLQLVVYAPQQIILKSNEYSNGIYFLIKGKIGLSLTQTKNSCFRKLSEGSFFGDNLILNEKQRVNFIVLGKKNAIILFLPKEFVMHTQYQLVEDYWLVYKISHMRTKILRILEKNYKRQKAQQTFQKMFFLKKEKTKSCNMGTEAEMKDEKRSEKKVGSIKEQIRKSIDEQRQVQRRKSSIRLIKGDQRAAEGREEQKESVIVKDQQRESMFKEPEPEKIPMRRKGIQAVEQRFQEEIQIINSQKNLSNSGDEDCISESSEFESECASVAEESKDANKSIEIPCNPDAIRMPKRANFGDYNEILESLVQKEKSLNLDLQRLKHEIRYMIQEQEVKLKKSLKSLLRLCIANDHIKRAVIKRHTKLSLFMRQ